MGIEIHTTTTPSNKRSCFMAAITKKTSRIFPTPRAIRARQRGRTTGAPPRRSRRIAGVEPEVVNATSSTRNKKKVMRALDIPGETEGISQEALEQYSKLFTQSSPLIGSHVQALAALFGWRTANEEELEQEFMCC
jgi:hypothetical protein